MGWYVILTVDIIVFVALAICMAHILDMGFIAGAFTVLMFLLLALHVFQICISIHAKMIFVAKHIKSESDIKKYGK